MSREQVLSLLLQQENQYVSGEAMSRTLGISRAAVWKAIEALRQEGYTIQSAPNRGYRLDSAPDRVREGELTGPLAGCHVGEKLLCLDTVDSTNTECKRQAMAGAPDGLVVISEEQTGGRGRRGRSFVSPPGKGLYLSVLLKPDCPLAQVPTLTAWSAVAVCDAVEQVCGVRPGIKWPNDVILEGRKLCGILTELELEAETAALRYVVVGIGVNISQTEADFGPEVAPVAVSLAQALGKAPRRAEVARALLDSLDRLYADFPQEGSRWLERYRADCLTVGKPIRVLSAGGERAGTALGIDEEFALRVAWEDGREETLSSGEVSVRGLLGYV